MYSRKIRISFFSPTLPISTRLDLWFWSEKIFASFLRHAMHYGSLRKEKETDKDICDSDFVFFHLKKKHCFCFEFRFRCYHFCNQINPIFFDLFIYFFF